MKLKKASDSRLLLEPNRQLQIAFRLAFKTFHVSHCFSSSVLQVAACIFGQAHEKEPKNNFPASRP